MTSSVPIVRALRARSDGAVLLRRSRRTPPTPDSSAPCVDDDQLRQLLIQRLQRFVATSLQGRLFDRDIYGKDLELRFIRYLRPEKKFENVDALVRQIERDVQQARELSAA